MSWKRIGKCNHSKLCWWILLAVGNVNLAGLLGAETLLTDVCHVGILAALLFILAKLAQFLFSR